MQSRGKGGGKGSGKRGVVTLTQQAKEGQVQSSIMAIVILVVLLFFGKLGVQITIHILFTYSCRYSLTLALVHSYWHFDSPSTSPLSWISKCAPSKGLFSMRSSLFYRSHKTKAKRRINVVLHSYDASDIHRANTHTHIYIHARSYICL